MVYYDYPLLSDGRTSISITAFYVYKGYTALRIERVDIIG
jgi:hypothetical protein